MGFNSVFKGLKIDRPLYIFHSSKHSIKFNYDYPPCNRSNNKVYNDIVCKRLSIGLMR